MKAKRTRQSAWCCGKNYLRWSVGIVRLSACVSRRATARTHCTVCGTKLEYSLITNKTLDAYYRQREKNLLAGLNVKGRPYQRRPNFLYQSMDPHCRAIYEDMRRQHIRQRVLKNWRKRAARFEARNLTTRGTVPKKSRQPRRAFLAYQELRATIKPEPSANWEYIDETNGRYA